MEPFGFPKIRVRSPSHFLGALDQFFHGQFRRLGKTGGEGRGEMNCGNLGEECGRRDFPGDTNNIYCLTSIEFLKQSVQQSNQIMIEKKNKYILLMVKQIQYLMKPCNCCNFLNKNLYCCVCF